MAQWVAIRMAEMIECGLRFPGVQEKPYCYLDCSPDGCRAGLLGLLMIAHTGDPGIALQQWMPPRIERAAELLGISVAFATMLELNHRNGMPAGSIARSLRAGTLCMTMPSFRSRAAAA